MLLASPSVSSYTSIYVVFCILPVFKDGLLIVESVENTEQSSVVSVVQSAMRFSHRSYIATRITVFRFPRTLKSPTTSRARGLRFFLSTSKIRLVTAS